VSVIWSAMNEQELAALVSWIANVGLQGSTETTLVQGFCGRAVAAGLPLARAIVFIDTLHPIHEGRVFRWERDQPAVTISEYGRSTEGEAAERWRRSPHYRLLETGESLMRRRVTAETEREFAPFPALWEAGITEFVATVNRFSADGAIGEMDCFYAGWMTDRESGFSDPEVETLERLTLFLGLAIKTASIARIANTLVETYLGRDAGRRVLQGRIARGVADRIKTVLWFSDLRNYTRISASAPPEEIIPLLNDYADAIVSAIHEHRNSAIRFDQQIRVDRLRPPRGSRIRAAL
jgi:adenylate cyclase